MRDKIFIDMGETEGVVHWLGIPYTVESSFRRRFYTVMDSNDECVIDDELECKVLSKFFKLTVRPKVN